MTAIEQTAFASQPRIAKSLERLVALKEAKLKLNALRLIDAGLDPYMVNDVMNDVMNEVGL